MVLFRQSIAVSYTHLDVYKRQVAYNIARKYIPENVEILPMVFQMSNDMEAVNAQWKENRNIIAQKLDEGKNLVFLTMGDPCLL